MKTLKESCFFVMLKNNLEISREIFIRWEYEYWKTQIVTCCMCQELSSNKLVCQRCSTTNYCQRCFNEETYVCGYCCKSVCYCCQKRNHSCLDCIRA